MHANTLWSICNCHIVIIYRSLGFFSTKSGYGKYTMLIVIDHWLL